MSYFTRKNILTAVIIALFVINIAALLTFVLRPAFLFPEREYSCKPRCKPGDFFKKELNLTDAQSVKFNHLRDGHADTIHALANRMREIRHSISDEMMKPAPDTVMIMSRSDELGQIYSSIRKLNVFHYWQLKALCQDEQKQRLDSIFGRLFCCNDGVSPRCEKSGPGEGCMHDRHPQGHKKNHPRH